MIVGNTQLFDPAAADRRCNLTDFACNRTAGSQEEILGDSMIVGNCLWFLIRRCRAPLQIEPTKRFPLFPLRILDDFLDGRDAVVN